MMIKTTLLATAATLFVTGAATAGNVAVVDVAAAAIVAPAANDWSGLYAGGLVSFDSGELQYSKIGRFGPIDELVSTTAFGGFAGYNIQRGSLVFGGEVAANSGGLHIERDENYTYGPIIDLKARAGYSFGKVLAYGAVGWSFATFNDDIYDTFASSGLAYGAGVDVMVGEHMFVGAEYLIRDIEGFGEVYDYAGRHGHIESAQIRVGWHF